MRILLVDDDPAARSCLRQFLEGLGALSVHEAADGQAAMEQIPSSRPNLIITDCQMPRMDGLRLTRALRAAGVEVPVIMVSGITDRTMIQSALDNGVPHFLP